MTKTVKQIVDEYLETQKNEYDTLLISINGSTYIYIDVTNFKDLDGRYEFDHVVEYNGEIIKKHVTCTGYVIMTSQTKKE